MISPSAYHALLDEAQSKAGYGPGRNQRFRVALAERGLQLAPLPAAIAALASSGFDAAAAYPDGSPFQAPAALAGDREVGAWPEETVVAWQPAKLRDEQRQKRQQGGKP